MKVIWKGDSDPLELINGKEYEVYGTDFRKTMFSVVDETGEEYLYPAEDFEIISGSPDEFVDPFEDEDEDCE